VTSKPSANFVDSVVNYFSPVMGARRKAARDFLAYGSYDGASRSSRPLSGWNPRGVDADSAANGDLPTLRARSQDMVRNQPLAAGIIHTKVNNIVGTGLRLQARIDRDKLGLSTEDADAWEKQTEREWRLWSESQDCDIERTLTFTEIQDLAMRSTLESGDNFILRPNRKIKGSPYGLKLQVVEADRVTNPEGKRDTPELSGGVEKDKFGAPVAYHFLESHPGSGTSKNSRKTIKVRAFGANTNRRNVLHLYRKTRPGQTRGIPSLAPVIESLKMLDRYMEAETMAAVVSACYTVFVTTEDGGQSNQGAVTQPQAGGGTADKLAMESGMILELGAGQSIETANPGRPNTAFQQFLHAILEIVGTSQELPFEVLRGHFSASYSASRAALLEAWKMFRARRKWLADKLCRPVYENWMIEAVALGRIFAPGFLTGDPAIRAAYLGSEWVGPSQGQIDPLREVKAAKVRVDEEFSTRATEAAALTGDDWDKIHPQRVKEENARREDETIMDAALLPEIADGDID